MQGNRSAPNSQAGSVPDLGAPFSLEAEESVIGSILANPEAYLQVASFLRGDDFYLVRHQYIWQAFDRIYQRAEPIDYLTASEELENLGYLEMVGGRGYLLQLVTGTPTSIHVEFYARIVQRTALRRRLLQAADEIRGLALNEELNVENVLDEAEAKLFNLSDTNLKREFVPMWDALSAYYDQLEMLLSNQGQLPGVPSGFRDLDQLLGGFQRSDLIVFAGRPGMGKTSFLLTSALNAARRKARVAIFTMEMGVEQIVQRMISMETGIGVHKLRQGQVQPHEAKRLTEALNRLSNLQIFIDDTPAMTPMEMRNKCRRLMHEHGLDLIMIDYMQLMNAGRGFENNRVQEISFISRHLKEMAREFNLPVISAAQLSRAVEQRHDKRPVLSDLRESGSIEQDADIVMFLYRDEVYNEATEYPNQADVIVAKHRNGPTNTISLYFEKQSTKFMDAAVHHVELSDLG